MKRAAGAILGVLLLVGTAVAEPADRTEGKKEPDAEMLREIRDLRRELASVLGATGRQADMATTSDPSRLIVWCGNVWLPFANPAAKANHR